MPASRGFAALLLSLALTAPAVAQDPGQPMSAIDWLSDSVATPPAAGSGPAGPVAPDAGGSALPVTLLPDSTTPSPLQPATPITVAPLDAGSASGPDAIGILSAAVTGLPAGLWGAAQPADIAQRIRAERPEMLPALQALLQTILLAELEPPRGPGGDGREVFLARVDKLLEMGALEQANALLERAGNDDPELFRRRFDVALLLGEEQPLCEVLHGSPQLSPTYQARIFCLAMIPEDDADLFARFLDPDLYEDEAPLDMPLNPTPLTFRMYEAIGQAIPTHGLPLAFAHSDLRDNIGWKARVEAGERLARTGAVSDNQLYGLYSERRAAASGGVWDRVAAVQSLERAMTAEYKAGTATALREAWAQLGSARVEVPVARILGPRLADMGLDGEAGRLAFRMALLSDDYETYAVAATPDTAFDRLLAAVARGLVTAGSGTDERSRAVVDGFTAPGPPVRLATLVETDRLGEAILRAITLLAEGTSGDLDQVTDALALLRAVGLEDTARRTALEFLILDRQD